MNGIELDDTEIGITDTTQLKSLLGVLNEEVELELISEENSNRTTSISINDKFTKVNYMLGELTTIPNTPPLKGIPEFQIEIPITKEFVDRFIKAKNALSDAETFTLVQGNDDKLKLIIGYSSINSNRISIDIEANPDKDKLNGTPLSFSAKYFKEVLHANSECKDAVFYVSHKGLAYVEFGSLKSEYQSKYYFVKIATEE